MLKKTHLCLTFFCSRMVDGFDYCAMWFSELYTHMANEVKHISALHYSAIYWIIVALQDVYI